MLKANDRTDNLIAFVFALLVYIPATSLGNMIRLGVVIVAFIMKHVNETPEPGMRKIALFMALSPFVSVFFVIMLEGFGVNWAQVTHEIQRMFFCTLLLMTVVKMRINFKLIYIITILVLLPNFIVQLLQYIKIESVFSFIRTNYESGVSAEEWTHLDLAREEGSGFRAGSIFVNPNVFMVIPLMSLVVFLHQDKERSTIWNYALIACATISCFLTGSRTATIVMAVIMIWYLVKYAKAISRFFLIIAIVFVLFNYGSYLVSSRAAQVFDSDSFEVKVNSFVWFWRSTSEILIYWLTGALGSLIASTRMDGEVGYIYAWFGVFGLIWYFRYYKYAYKNNTHLVFFAKPLTAVHLFVAFTASVLLCMPIYSYAAIVVFSKLKDSDLELENSPD